MKPPNPYPSTSPRHVIQTYVGTEDWQFLQGVTGCARGFAANLLAITFRQFILDLKQQSCSPIYEPANEPKVQYILQRIQLRGNHGN